MKKLRKNEIVNTLGRYQLSTFSKSVLGFISILLLIIYFCLSYYENSFSVSVSMQENVDFPSKTLNYIYAFKDCTLIILSISLTSFLSTFLIETKNKNSIVTDLIAKDVFSNPEFYAILNETHKENILNHLETDLYFTKQSELQNMFSSMRDSVLKISKDKIYYEKCSIDITCSIQDKFIEKRILRTVKVKSYNGTTQLNKHLLMICAYTDSSDYKAIEINKFNIDKTPINLSNIEEIPDYSDSPFNDKSGYNVMKKYVYKDSIDVDSEEGKEIQLEYITRVPLNDKTYSCRMPYACKSFSFEFSIQGNNIDNYRLNTIAFGFIDDGKGTPNRTGDHLTTKVSFNNWIFPYDGVAVTICNNS